MRKVDPAKIVREIAKREREHWTGEITFRFQDGDIMNVREAYDLPIANSMSIKECEKSFLENLTEEERNQVIRHIIGLQGYRAFGKTTASTASMAHGKLTKLHVDRSISIEKFWES